MRKENIMSRYLDQIPPIQSPWGGCQTAEEHAPGIWHVTTASHGGYILTTDRNDEIPETARLAGAIYEEDSDWAIVGWFFRDRLTDRDPAYPVQRAHDILLNWHPDIYEDLTGKQATPETSFVLRRRQSINKLIGQEIITSARLAHECDGPGRNIIATTRIVHGIDRHNFPTFAHGEPREWLIPEADYDARQSDLSAITSFDRATPRT